MFGLLNINKPAGITSRDVVDRVERVVYPDKAGHAGTLDPIATGVLVVCVGPATRLIEYVQRMPKRYLATFLLGQSSPTDDVEGELTPVENAPQPTLAEITQAASRFVGRIQQRPPAYSAVKVAGRRAYKLARAGKTVELAARPIDIFSLQVVRYEYPELVLDIECGSGTYVRSLGRDLAEVLGTAAVMSVLERTAIGSFRVEEACPLDQLRSDTLQQWLLDPLRALDSLPRVTVDAEELIELRHGRTIDNIAGIPGESVAVDESGRLVALVVPRENGMHLGPMRNFVETE